MATRAKEVGTPGEQWLLPPAPLAKTAGQQEQEHNADRAMLGSEELCQCVRETGVQDTGQSEVSKRVTIPEAAPCGTSRGRWWVSNHL